MTGLAGDPQRRFPGRKRKSGISCREEMNVAQRASQGVLECANAINVQSMNRPLTDTGACDTLGETDFERMLPNGQKTQSGRHIDLFRACCETACETAGSGRTFGRRMRREDGVARLLTLTGYLEVLGERPRSNAVKGYPVCLQGFASEAARPSTTKVIKLPFSVGLKGSLVTLTAVASVAVMSREQLEPTEPGYPKQVRHASG